MEGTENEVPMTPEEETADDTTTGEGQEGAEGATGAEEDTDEEDGDTAAA